RRSRETGDRRSDRAAAGVRRVSGHRPGPRSRRDSRLQGSRASLPARSAPARGPPCRDGGGARASADAPRDGPGVPRAPAARRRLEPRGVCAARRRVRGARGPGWRGGEGGLMQLLRLRLVNFRQHADTELEFGPGITGIIGPNGSGKTTILEAIAWALYGAQAVRGDKDSIRRLGAKGRAGVEVDLEFRRGARRGAPGRRTAAGGGPDGGEGRGRGAPCRGGRAGPRGAALERLGDPPRAHAVARRRAAHGGAGGGVVAPGIPAARQGARG